MTRSILRRILSGAALTMLLGSVALVPARAAVPPVITWVGAITEGASYVFGAVPAAPTCTAVDELGADVPCAVAGYATTVGTHTLVASAVAADLTTAQAQLTYSVTAWNLKGFSRPVRMTEVNKVKAGSTVPLKFKVYAGAAKLKDPAVISAFTAQQVGCTDGAALGDPVPVTSAGKGFRLKYRDGAFHQNWKTPKAAKASAASKGGVKKPAKPVSTCYRVTMTTLDGSALSALFSLK